MKYSLKKEINYFEIDPHFRLKLGSLVKLLQEAAIAHSESVGRGAQNLIDRGVAWVLNKMGIDIIRYPRYKEKLEIVTWSTGLRGLKAFREFEVYAESEKIATASSSWFLIDIAHKKIKRVPPEIIDVYTTDKSIALKRDLADWSAETNFAAENEVKITTRSSDCDSNGHVNNSVYFEYLETLLSKVFGDAVQVRSLNIYFAKEINREVEWVTAGLKKGNLNLYKIHDENQLFACGDLSL
jgi:acyl-ACP thioesterase